MNSDYPSPPSEPGIPSWAEPRPPVKPAVPAQGARPIPDPTAEGAIRYPSETDLGAGAGAADPSDHGATVPLQPADSPVSSAEITSPLPAAPAASPDPVPSRSGVGRGLFLGLFLAAIIAAAAFGLGRMSVQNDDPVADTIAETTVATSTTETSLVAATEPPPVAVVPPTTDGELEPVAAAAAAITPAVVRLDTGAGTGSGVIYDADGYILTAAHVLGSANSVAVRFADGSSTTGTVLGADDTTDVAVVEIDPELVPAVAELAVGSKLTVGQTAVAVGSPFRLDQTVTSGIISAVDRIVNSVSMVQTDAAINPGNSGGPLVDLNARVLGINDVIFTNSNDNAGVGFAISIDLAKIVADQITSGQEVSLALLGVSVGSSPNGDAGGLVQSVGDGSAAAGAGIEVGDLIITVDGDPIRDSEELRAEVITRAPGTVVTIELIRGDERLSLNVALGSISTG